MKEMNLCDILPYIIENNNLDQIELLCDLIRLKHNNVGELVELTIREYPNHKTLKHWTITAIEFESAVFYSKELHRKLETNIRNS